MSYENNETQMQILAEDRGIPVSLDEQLDDTSECGTNETRNTSMRIGHWIARFRKNKESRPKPDWRAPITLSPSVVRRLVRSLEQFQLGDGGGPACLIAWNAERFRSSSEDMRTL